MAQSKLTIVINASNKAAGTLKSVGGSLAGIGKIAGGVAVAGVAAATTAVVGLGIALGKLAIDAAPIENIKKSFEDMVEASGKSTSGMLDSLKEQSAGMITNTDLMKSYNTATQLVSAEFANRLPEAMQYLGKVAGATGQDMGYMLDSLVTGVGRGSKMILDNLGITVDLEGAYAAYAEELGKTTSELTDSEKQTGLMNTVMEQLAENTKDMPDLMGSASQQLGAFKATVQNTKDAIGLALLPVMKNVFDFIQPFIGKVENIISAFYDAGLGSMEFREALSTIFSEDVLDFLYDKIIPAFERFGEIVGGLISGDMKLSDLIPPEMMDTIQPMIDAIVNLGSTIAEDFPLMQEKAQEFIDFVKTNFSETFPVIMQNVTDMINTMSELWEKHGETIISVVTTTLQLLVAAFTGAFTVLTGLTSGAWTMLLGIFDAGSLALQGNWSGAWEAIKASGITAWGAISSSFLVFVDGILKATGTNLEEFTTIWSNNWDMAKIIVDDMGTNIVNSINDFLVGIVQDVVAWVVDVTGSFNDVVSNIQDAFDVDWSSIGSAIINGIAGGISGAISTLVDAATDAAESAITAAKEALGVQSPSKVFMEIGENLMKGLAIGVEDSEGIPSGTIQNASNSMIPSLAGAGPGGFGGGVTLIFNYSPTVSLGDRMEAENVIAPLIEGTLRDFVRDNGVVSRR